ncbi:MAG: hypothetical protein QM796_11065 [Chthoniobacteraceae bacterium]
MKKSIATGERKHELAWLLATIATLLGGALIAYFVPAWVVLAGYLFLLALGYAFELFLEYRNAR